MTADASTRHLSPQEAMDRAVALAARGPVVGANPRVGCVLLAADGVVIGEGWHRGAGTAHAEVAALADAQARGNAATGAMAVVTLEPCNHTGRTGPCAQALLEAGVTSVIYAVADPGDASAGGAATLTTHGVQTTHAPHDGAAALNARWLTAMQRHRPYVIAKWAATLDGRIAAADGSSFWITGEEARGHAHQVRAEVDAIAVGTGTVLADDPSLSARPPATVSGSADGSADVEHGHQPLRVVVGSRPTPGAKVWRDDNSLAVREGGVSAMLETLWRRDVRTVLIEGGAGLVTSCIAAGVVDEIHAYIAPVVLGSGTSAVEDLGISTMSEALRGADVSMTRLGADTLICAKFTRGT